MINKAAIEKAIEGGWSDGKHVVEVNDKWGVRLLAASGYAQWEFKFEEIALDPSFWVALGYGEAHMEAFVRAVWRGKVEQFWEELLK